MARPSAALATLGLLASVVVGVAFAPTADAAADTAAPTVTSYRILPTSVDVTSADRTATAVVRVADSDGAGHAGSGFDHGTLTLSNGTALPLVPFDHSNRVSGTGTDGTYDVAVALPQGTAAGSYTAALTLTDATGNSSAPIAITSAPLTVVRTPDTASPVAPAKVVATPSAVDVTTTAKDVTYSVRLTDAVAGVTDATITVKPPGVPGTDLVLTRTSGTALDGTWSGTSTVPSSGPGGTWTISKLLAHDGYGNTLTQTTSLGGLVTVTRPADITGPTLVSATSTSVDTSTADATANVTLRTTDDISGVSYGDVIYTSPDGSQFAYGFLSDTLISGSVTSGTWTAAVDFPARSDPGVWTLTQADLYDNAGNATSYDVATVAPPASNVTVTTATDTTLPSLTSFEIGPSQVTTTYDGGARVVGHIGVADTGSGVATAEIVFRDPTGAVDDTQTLLVDATSLTSGTTGSGVSTFSSVLTDVLPGTWTVASVTLTDLAGNATTLLTAKLGTRTTFHVADVADTAAPTLTSLTLSPGAVSTATTRTVTSTLGVLDPGDHPAGLSDATVELTSPSGKRTLDFAFTTPATGDYRSGTYTDTATLDRYTEGGDWQVTSVVLTDEAANTTTMARGDVVAALGSAPTLTVTPARDTTAPALTAATTPATADVRTGDAITVHVTGTDAGSGLASATVELSGPDGRTASGTASDTAGSPLSLDVPVDVPAFGSAGTWSISRVTLVDGSGNSRTSGQSEVGALSGLHAVAVTSTADTTAPTAANLALTPAPVNTTNGAVDVDVLVELADAGAGVDTATVLAQSPSGAQNRTVTLTRLAGTAQDGWWQGTLALPRYAESGTWTVGPLTATDAVGNTLTAASATLGPAASLVVTGPTADVKPPTVTALSLAPTSFDTGAGDQVVTVTVGAADSQSGVSDVRLDVSSPSGRTSRSVVLTPNSGSNPYTANYSGSLTVPAYSETGAWTVDAATVTDARGNVARLTRTQLAAAGYPTAFTVTGAADTTPPALASLTLNPASVDVSAGDRIVNGSLAATDSQSGLASGTVTYTGANGASVRADLDPGARTAGTTANPTIPFVLRVPRYAPPGTWTLSGLTLVDRAGNSTSYPPRALPAGVAASLAVADTTPDQIAPTLTGVTATPGTLDVRSASGTVAVSVGLNDDASGVTDGTVVVTSPSGQSDRRIAFTGDDRISGDARSGTYRVLVPFPAHAEAGAWTVGLGRATDAAGNVVTAGGSPQTVTVSSTAVAPDAPDGITAAAGNTRAIVDWTAPANGGNPITGYVITPARNGAAQPPVTVPGTATEKVLTGLPNGAAYSFTVSATNGAGTGAASAPSSAVTPAATVPDAPTAATATPADGGITVSWTAPADTGGSAITGYLVSTYLESGVALRTDSVGAATTSRTVTGLANGSRYYATVRAVSALGTGAAATTTTVTPTAASLPGAPTIGAVSLTGPTSATVTWTAPASTGGSPITAYTVAGAPSGGCTSSGATTCTVTGLAKGVTYTFSVTASTANGTGLPSAASAAVTVPATPAAAPVIGTATLAGPDGATVTWTPPADTGGSPVTGYVITPFVGSIPGPTTTVRAVTSGLVTGLVKGTTYTFTVAAVNSAGTSAASAATTSVTVPGTAAAAPTIGTATLLGQSGATITWTPPTDTGGSAITGYLITPYVGGSAKPATTVGPASSGVVTGLLKGVTYTFTVAAITSAGTGSASAPSNSLLIPVTAPGAPAVSAPTLAGSDGATLTWAPIGNGGSPLTGYTIAPYRDGTAQEPVVVGPDVTTTTLTGLTKGSAYTFTVAATNAVGTGAPSAATSALTIPTTAPGAPTAGTATLAGATGALVSWVAPGDTGGRPITGYTVTPYLAGIAQAATTVGAVTGTTIDGLTRGATYTFRVVATNAVGSGPASAPTGPLTIPAVPPSAPTAVTATPVPTGLAVSWTAPASTGGAPVTGYTVTGLPGGTCTTTGATTCVVTAVTTGTAYTFTVRATNSAGDSPASAASAPTVAPATVPDAPRTVTATVTGAGVAVTWLAPLDDGGSPVTGYAVTGTPGGACTTSGATTCTVTGLAPGATATFVVRAVNAIGTGAASTPSAPVTVPAQAPSAPVAPAATPGIGSVTLGWGAPASTGGAPLRGYAVTATTLNGTPAGTCSTQGALTCTVGGLVARVPYRFTVVAANSVGPGPASVPVEARPQTHTTVTLLSTSSRVVYGSALVATGHLARADNGAAVAGQLVYLHYRLRGSTGGFHRVSTPGTTDSRGNVRLAMFRPHYSVELRLWFPNAGALLSSTSSSRSTLVSRNLSISLRPGTITRGHSFAVTGRVLPGVSGQKVYLQRHSGTRWVAVTTTRTRAGGLYTFSVRPRSRGRFAYRIVTLHDPSFLTSASSYRTVTVR